MASQDSAVAVNQSAHAAGDSDEVLSPSKDGANPSAAGDMGAGALPEAQEPILLPPPGPTDEDIIAYTNQIRREQAAASEYVGSIESLESLKEGENVLDAAMASSD